MEVYLVRIAMVTPWNVRCGIATYSRSLVEAIANHGHEVYVIKLPRFGLMTEATLQNVVDMIPMQRVELIHVQHEYGLYHNLEDPFYRRLNEVRAGKPIITTMHAIGSWTIDRTVAMTSNRVIVHNRFCQEKFEGQSRIIRHGTSPLQTPPPPIVECKKSLGINPTMSIVGYLGFISTYKGLETLIHAMVKVPQAGLLIGGGWHTEEETQYLFELKELTLKLLPKRCTWLGYISDQDMSKVYASMDCLVYPSRYATESGALLTALSNRKAVIANALKPFKEKEKEGALITFKRDSVAHLAAKIRKVLRDDTLRRSLEEGAQQYCERTAWSHIAAEHITLYQERVNAVNMD